MHPQIAARVFNAPLLVHPGKAAAFLAGLGPRLLGRDVAPLALAEAESDRPARPAFASLIGGEMADHLRDHRTGYGVVNGVAVIPVSGTLVSRGAWVGQSSGLTSYEGLRAQIDAAADDPEVRAVALEIDSFGGEVAGLFDLCARVRALRAVKPVRAYLADCAYSAAYALAAQADRIVISQTGGAGSIGVVVMHVDMSAALAEGGLAVTLIHAGAHKVDGNPYQPLPDAVRAALQTDIDAMRQAFADAVAAGRPALPADAALATEARCYTGAAAIAAGLADDLADPAAAFRTWVGELDAGASAPVPAAPAAQMEGGRRMARKTRAEQAMDEEKKVVTPAPEDEAMEEGTEDEAMEEGEEPEAMEDEDEDTAPVATALAAERRRIAAILTAPEAEGRDALARHFALSTGLAPKAARAALAAAPQGGKGSLARAMAGAQPKLVAGAADRAAGAPRLADRMAARFQKKGA